MNNPIRKIRNLLERFKTRNQPTVITEQAEFTKDFSMKSLSNEDLSLSTRKLKYYMKKPIDNDKIKRSFQKVGVKLKGFKLWSKINQEVKAFGTNSNLFDAHDAYRQNIDQIMESKIKSITNTVTEDLPRLGILFHPDSKFKIFWNAIILLSLIYVITVMPLIMAFSDVTIGSTIFIFETMIDFIFFFDMFVTLNSAYLDNNGHLETKRSTITKNYLTGFFVLDFLSIFPFWIFSDVNSTNTHSLTRMIRIAKIARIFRISKLVTILRSVMDSKSMSSIIEFFLTYQGATRLATIGYSIILIAHFISCIWYFIARIEGIYPDTWVARTYFDQDSEQTIYLRGIYFAFSVMNTVGFGDIYPYLTPEIALCIVIMMFGICFYSFLVATLTSILTSLDAKTSKFNDKRKILKELQAKLQITKGLKSSIKRYMRNAKYGDIGMFKETILELPTKLQYLLVLSMHNKAPSLMPLFKSNEERFAISVIPKLFPVSYRANEIIYQKGSSTHELYFIGQGRVSYIFGPNNLQMKTFPVGSYFGDVELVKHCPRRFTAFADEPCNLLVMPSRVYTSIVKQFPKVAKKIMKKVSKQSRKDMESSIEINDIVENCQVKMLCEVEDLAEKERLSSSRQNQISIPPTIFSRKPVSHGAFLSKTQSLASVHYELQELRTQVDFLCNFIDNLCS